LCADDVVEELPDRYESEVDENGIKTVIEYAKDVKTAERVKVAPYHVLCACVADLPCDCRSRRK